jgi:hypothetical protein
VPDGIIIAPVLLISRGALGSVLPTPTRLFTLSTNKVFVFTATLPETFASPTTSRSTDGLAVFTPTRSFTASTVKVSVSTKSCPVIEADAVERAPEMDADPPERAPETDEEVAVNAPTFAVPWTSRLYWGLAVRIPTRFWVASTLKVLPSTETSAATSRLFPT